ncbi:MAG: exonuclease domain-containing protein [Bacillota bacterium]
MPIELQRYTPQVGEQCGLAAFVDVETTGLSPQSDEVVEFATALFAFDRTSGRIKGVVDEYVGLRDPGRPIPAKATEVHGIRDHDVRGKRLDDGRILELMSQAEFLVAHNAPFDSGFVERLYPEAADKTWLCSMREIPWIQKGFESRGLQNLLKDHGIQPGRAHRGRYDVRAALQLLSCKDEDGVYYFKHLLDCHEGRAPAAQAAATRAPVASVGRTRTAIAAKTARAPKGRISLIERVLRLFTKRDR